MNGQEIKVGTTGLKQVCLVVKDLVQAEQQWSKILNMPAEHLVTPPWNETPSYTDGKADSFREKFILFRLANGVLLEIYGPGEHPENPWGRYLREHGEGVMNFAFYVDEERDEAYRQIGEATGVAAPYHEGFYPDCTYSFVATHDILGVELNIKREEDNRDRIGGFLADPLSYRSK